MFIHLRRAGKLVNSDQIAYVSYFLWEGKPRASVCFPAVGEFGDQYLEVDNVEDVFGLYSSLTGEIHPHDQAINPTI